MMISDEKERDTVIRKYSPLSTCGRGYAYNHFDISFCANDSHKNAEIKKNQYVQLMFQGSAHSDFLNLYGSATITTDKKKIKKQWESIVKAWFTEGVMIRGSPRSR